MPGGKNERTQRTGWGYSGADDETLGRGRTANPATAAAGLRSSPVFRWVGALPTRGAVLILLGAAAIGMLGTLLTKNEPGSLLALCIIAGSAAAALSIGLRSVYLLIPMPALIFFFAAVVTGAVHDRGIDTSRSQTYLSFVQWIADVFFGMCAATILVVVISGGRWLFSRLLVSGQFATPGGPGGGRGPRGAPVPGQRADRDRRPPGDSDTRRPAPPWGDRDNPGGQRANRGLGDGRDPRGDGRQPRGDSRQPGDRGYPGNQPPGGGYPGNQPPGGGYPGNQPSGGGYPGNQPPGGGYPGNQPPGGGYPDGQQSGGAGRPGDRTLPPGRDPLQRGPRGPRDQWDDRGPQGPGGQRSNRDERDSDDPWSRRLPQ